MLVLLLGAFSVVIPSITEAYQEGDYSYSISGSPSVVTITGYNGSGGAITIPSTLGGYSVVAIDSGVFRNRTSLTSVTIPDSVMTIGDWAFYYCTSLTSISFLGSVAPAIIGLNWISGTPSGLAGHAYSESDFPGPGGIWNGLTMGAVIQLPGLPSGS